MTFDADSLRKIADLERRLKQLESQAGTGFDTIFAGSMPFDHFNKPALNSAWSWDAVTFGGTPSGVSLASVPSNLSILHSAITTVFFLKKAWTAVNGSYVSARFMPTVDTISGLRIDDGTDNNYSEIRIVNGATQGTKKLQFRFRTGGGAVTTTDKIDNIPNHPISLLMQYSSSPNTFGAYGLEPHSCVNGAGGWAYFGNLAAFPGAPTRAGLLHSNVTLVGSASRRTLVDWYHEG